MKIMMDREDSEKEEKGEGDPRTQYTLFYPHQEGPKS
jgi:hypothetical protein